MKSGASSTAVVATTRPRGCVRLDHELFGGQHDVDLWPAGQIGDLHGHSTRQHAIVGVEERHEGAGGILDASIPGGGGPEVVRKLEEPKLGVLDNETPSDLG